MPHTNIVVTGYFNNAKIVRNYDIKADTESNMKHILKHGFQTEIALVKKNKILLNVNIWEKDTYANSASDLAWS